MTIHKSKGLEYHTVIFVGLDDGAWWSFKKDEYEATARRLESAGSRGRDDCDVEPVSDDSNRISGIHARKLTTAD
jgi:ATP-dependent exoDNAse (exonuclease V) beta subunit